MTIKHLQGPLLRTSAGRCYTRPRPRPTHGSSTALHTSVASTYARVQPRASHDVNIINHTRIITFRQKSGNKKALYYTGLFLCIVHKKHTTFKLRYSFELSSPHELLERCCTRVHLIMSCPSKPLAGVSTLCSISSWRDSFNKRRSCLGACSIFILIA